MHKAMSPAALIGGTITLPAGQLEVGRRPASAKALWAGARAYETHIPPRYPPDGVPLKGGVVWVMQKPRH
jgi:hypothetical protein